MAQDRKISIFLFLVLGVLGLFILSWAYGIFTKESSFAKHTSANTIQCTNYAFEIGDIIYKDNILTFTIENKEGDKIDSIVIVGESEKTIKLSNFERGTLQQITVSDINLVDGFLIYPTGCKEDAKRYTI